MKTILIPSNFTDISRHATDYAIRLYGSELKRIILLNAYEQPKTGRSIHISLVEIMRKNSEKGLEEDKLRIQEDFPDLKADIVLRTTQGDLSSSIKSVIEELPVDLIVMGSKGDLALVDIIIESVTARVIKNVQHPMLIVPPSAQINGMKGLVLATDLKPISSSSVLKEMLDLARIMGSHLDILNVNKSNPEVSTEIEKMYDGLLSEVPHEFHYRHNTNIHSGIYKFLLEKDADIVCLVKRRGGGTLVDRLFHQSVSRRIAKSVRQTLLLLND
ncbi:MAG: universal stress protein [Vicingaceae bacterium]